MHVPSDIKNIILTGSVWRRWSRRGRRTEPHVFARPVGARHRDRVRRALFQLGQRQILTVDKPHFVGKSIGIRHQISHAFVGVLGRCPLQVERCGPGRLYGQVDDVVVRVFRLYTHTTCIAIKLKMWVITDILNSIVNLFWRACRYSIHKNIFI